MKFFFPLFLLLTSLSTQAKNLNIEECLQLVDFDPAKYIQADISWEEYQPLVDIKNGYYEIKDTDTDRILCQAAKFNNKDGSVTLMITGYYSDMQCSNHFTQSYLIFPDGKKYIEMGLEELNLPSDYAAFIGNEILNKELEKLLIDLKGIYLSEEDNVGQVYNELYDFHYILPRYGTDISVSLTICDYIPTNEMEIKSDVWDLIEESVPTKSLSYDKKFIKFEL